MVRNAGYTQSNFYLRFQPTAPGLHTGVVALYSDALPNPYELPVRGSMYRLSTNAGPWAGGGQLTIEGDYVNVVTQVLVCNVRAEVVSQTSTALVVQLRQGGNGLGAVRMDDDAGTSVVLSNAYRYHGQPLIDEWLTWDTMDGALMPTTVYYHAGAVLDGKVYLAGGLSPARQSCLVWDPGAPTGAQWSALADLPFSNYYHSVAAAGGRLYSLGGNASTGGAANAYLSSAYVYNPATPGDGWVAVSNLPEPRARSVAVTLGSRIWMVAGYTNGASATCVAYDTAHPELGWAYVSNYPVAGYAHAAAVYGDNLYSVGGVGSASFFAYAPAENQWTTLPGLPRTNYAHSLVAVTGRLVCLGGYDRLTNVYSFSPSRPAAGWRAQNGLPDGRYAMVSVTLSNTIYVLGGRRSTTAMATQFRGVFSRGVTPAAGSVTGGFPVVITGVNLGDGSDVTNVTLAGVRATVASQSPTQLVVTAGVAGGPVSRSVLVQSASRGETSLEDSFVYTGPVGEPDTDGDGMPDAWETAHGLNPAYSNAATANADGDAFTDWEEYLADTSPTNASAFFPLVTVTNPSGPVLHLRVAPTSTGRVYGVRWSTNLMADQQVWGLVPPEQTGTGAALYFEMTNYVPMSIYRTGVRPP